VERTQCGKVAIYEELIEKWTPPQENRPDQQDGDYLLVLTTPRRASGGVHRGYEEMQAVGPYRKYRCMRPDRGRGLRRRGPGHRDRRGRTHSPGIVCDETARSEIAVPVRDQVRDRVRSTSEPGAFDDLDRLYLEKLADRVSPGTGGEFGRE
jgi:hypothetical protein